MLKALAKYHLGNFERQRSEKQLTRENRARFWTLVATSFSSGAAVTGAFVALLKATGVL